MAETKTTETNEEQKYNNHVALNDLPLRGKDRVHL